MCVSVCKGLQPPPVLDRHFTEQAGRLVVGPCKIAAKCQDPCWAQLAWSKHFFDPLSRIRFLEMVAASELESVLPTSPLPFLSGEDHTRGSKWLAPALS